jgi:hypothetical protein
VVAASPNSSESTFTDPTDVRLRANHRCSHLTRWKTDRFCFGSRRRQSRHLGKASLRRRSHSTDSRPADDHQPSFSPDGGQIVFRSERDGGGIYIISALGGEDRLLTSKGRNPRFSPAGDWIAFWVGPVAGYPLGAQAGKIFLIPPTGGNPKQSIHQAFLRPDARSGHRMGLTCSSYGSDSSNLAVWFPTADWWVWPVAGVKRGPRPGRSMSLQTQNIQPDPSESDSRAGRVDGRPGFLQCQSGRQCEFVAGLHLA